MASSSGVWYETDMDGDEEEEPYLPGDFEGASGRVDDVLEMVKQKHVCQICDEEFEHWDRFAYCDSQGEPIFAQNSTLTQTKAQALGEGYSNLAVDNQLLTLTCVICCEKKMKQVFTVKKGESFTLTSAWRTLARRTKPNMALQNKKLQIALQTMEDRINRDVGPDGVKVNIKEVYDLTKSSLARQASDWVCEVAFNLSILYGCSACGVYPLQSSSWWRCNSSIDNKTGMVTGGHWRCAGCLKRFNAGFGSEIRLLAMGDEHEYSYFQIGKTSTLVEAKLRFLVMVQMVTEINGKPVTKEVLLECIRTLNERTQRRLSSFKEVVTLTAKDPAEMNVQIFCSDSRLYLHAVGQRFQALHLKDEPIEVLDEEGQNAVLDFAFGLTNWEEKWPQEPSLRKVFRGLEISPVQVKSRAELVRIMGKL
jgi:hypothetical protein